MAAADRNEVGALPLILCDKYGKWPFVRRVSKQPWSEGDVFYCCPAHKRNGDGCPGFYWEHEYINLLKKKKTEGMKIEAPDGFDDAAVSSSKQGGCSVAFDKKAGVSSLGSGNNNAAVVDGLRQVLGLIRVICVLLTGILFVSVLNLFVLLIKH